MAGDGDTDESPAVDAGETKVGAPAIESPEGEQSPADAQRGAEGRPEDPLSAAVQAPAPTAGDDKPEGTGPGGSVRGGYGVGATGPEGGSDVRGPSDTGSAGGGQSPAAAQRRGDEAAHDPFAEKPHLYVAGAFVGGLVVAQILKRLGGGDD
jgi:hypothetical protein